MKFHYLLFSFNCFLSSTTEKINGIDFDIQKIEELKNIKIGNHNIPYAVYEAFSRNSKLGFKSEDDVIVLVKFFLVLAKKIKFFIPNNISLNKLIEFENTLNFMGFNPDTSSYCPCADSNVVRVFEYVISKKDKNCKKKLNQLNKIKKELNDCKDSEKKLNESAKLDNFEKVIKKLFRDVGEIPIFVFDNKDIKKGSIIITEEENLYRVCYIDSDPYEGKVCANAKVSIKNIMIDNIQSSYFGDNVELES